MPKFHRKGVEQDSFYISNDRVRLRGDAHGNPTLNIYKSVGDIRLREWLRFPEGFRQNIHRSAGYYAINAHWDMASIPEESG